MLSNKKTVRAALLEQRNMLKKTNRWGELNAKLCQFVADWLGRTTLQTIGLFYPIGSEPDIRSVALRLSAEKSGLKLYLPVTIGEEMIFRRWLPQQALTRGKFGIPEPQNTECAAPDLLLIPCVGIDPLGHRLGYGGGFYDRYLQKAAPRPLAAGICFSPFASAQFQPEVFDAAMDWIITEKSAVKTTPTSHYSSASSLSASCTCCSETDSASSLKTPVSAVMP